MNGYVEVLSGAKSGERFSLAPLEGKGTMLVGSSGGCDLRLTEEWIAPRHCRLTLAGQELILEDLGSGADTILNQEPVTGKTAVHDGDIVDLSGVLLQVVFDPRPTRTEPEGAAEELLELSPEELEEVASAPAGGRAAEVVTSDSRGPERQENAAETTVTLMEPSGRDVHELLRRAAQFPADGGQKLALLLLTQRAPVSLPASEEYLPILQVLAKGELGKQ